MSVVQNVFAECILHSIFISNMTCTPYVYTCKKWTMCLFFRVEHTNTVKPVLSKRPRDAVKSLA